MRDDEAKALGITVGIVIIFNIGTFVLLVWIAKLIWQA